MTPQFTKQSTKEGKFSKKTMKITEDNVVIISYD